jgi:hypothetical protein
MVSIQVQEILSNHQQLASNDDGIFINADKVEGMMVVCKMFN